MSAAVPTNPPALDQPTTSSPVDPTPTTPIDLPATAPAGPAVAVSFAVADADGTLRPATSLSLLTTQAMYIVADWSGLPGDQTEAFELVSPSGSRFLATSFVLAESPGAPATLQALADGTLRATYRIGIRGTSITQYQRTGTWTVHVQLADGSASGSAAIELTL